MQSIRLPRGCQSSIGEDDASYITSPIVHHRDQNSFIKIKDTSQDEQSIENMTPNYKKYHNEYREECHSDIQHLRAGSLQQGFEKDRYSH